MTTFTTNDREEEYKKILEETQALEKGLEFFKKLKGDNASPPHIVDSGASVMKDEPVAYINVEERKLEWAKPMTWHTPTIAQMDKIPLYIIPNTEPVAWTDGKGHYFDKNSFFPVDDLTPLYTHPAKTLIDDAVRYQWLRNEYAHGRETYLAEGIPSGEKLDEYIDEQLRKAQEK